MSSEIIQEVQENTDQPAMRVLPPQPKQPPQDQIVLGELSYIKIEIARANFTIVAAFKDKASVITFMNRWIPEQKVPF